MFFETFKTELIVTGFVLVFLLIVRLFTNTLVRKIGRKSGINDARIKLIIRYVSVTLFLLALLIEAFVFGA